jgi:hypothetical protein
MRNNILQHKLFSKSKNNSYKWTPIWLCFYVANCAIRTNQTNADELMERFFISDYPTSQNKIWLTVRRSLLNKKNFPQALEWFW